MRGHLPLIAMRRDGFKPRMVFVHTDSSETPPPSWTQWQHNGGEPDIEIPASESLRRIDWRWTIGLTISLSGTTEARVRQAAQALIEAKAARVIYHLMHRDANDRFTSVWLHDTAGLLGSKEESEHGAHVA